MLAVLNGVVSYRLSIPGEEYWLIFAEFFSKIKSELNVELFKHFLRSVKRDRSLDQKLERLTTYTVIQAGHGTCNEWFILLERLRGFSENLVHVLKAKRSSKTLVFAIKMMDIYVTWRA